VLDLETLASHRGSVLGDLPETQQPGQKHFDTSLWQALKNFNTDQPVYVESESRKIGNLHLPDSMVLAIRNGQVTFVEAPLPARVDFLLREYAFWLERPEPLQQRLHALRTLRGGETVERWKGWVTEGRFRELVEALLAEHYDPSYRATQARNYDLEKAPILHTDSLAPEAIEAMATELLA
jgi:tRNA 2-selenouridine synthase